MPARVYMRYRHLAIPRTSWTQEVGACLSQLNAFNDSSVFIKPISAHRSGRSAAKCALWVAFMLEEAVEDLRYCAVDEEMGQIRQTLSHEVINCITVRFKWTVWRIARRDWAGWRARSSITTRERRFNASTPTPLHKCLHTYVTCSYPRK